MEKQGTRSTGHDDTAATDEGPFSSTWFYSNNSHESQISCSRPDLIRKSGFFIN